MKRIGQRTHEADGREDARVSWGRFNLGTVYVDVAIIISCGWEYSWAGGSYVKPVDRLIPARKAETGKEVSMPSLVHKGKTMRSTYIVQRRKRSG